MLSAGFKLQIQFEIYGIYWFDSVKYSVVIFVFNLQTYFIFGI